MLLRGRRGVVYSGYCRIEVHQFHGDPVLGMIHCFHCRQRIIDRNLLHHSKIEIHRFRLGAGYYLTVLDLQTRIGIACFVPRQDIGVVMTVPASIHVDADGIVRHDLSSC